MNCFKFYRVLLPILLFCTASALDYASVLLDTTASMNKERGDGSTRCDLSFQIAENSINEFFDLRSGKLINIYTFGVSGNLKSISGGFVNKTTALAKFRALNKGCNASSTALAESICKASDQLRNYAESRSSNDIALFVATDGKELSSQECGGVNKISNDFEISKQWHKSVYTKIIDQEQVIPVVAHLFWPDAHEIPDDFYFMKYLSIVSNGESYGSGALSKTHAQFKLSKGVYSQVIADSEVFSPGSIWLDL